MFASQAFGSSIAFGTGGSGSSSSMSFAANRRPVTVSIRAFTETAPRVDVRKPNNLYDVLNLKESASAIEIKAAYRSLAKRFHPDAVKAAGAGSSDDDSKDFIEIHNAYSVLSDPTEKAKYDVSIGVGGRQQVRYGRFNGSGIVGTRTRRWETDQCW